MNCLLALVLVHSPMVLEQSQFPFEPARAADQRVVTTRSLEEEFDQFRALAQAETTLSQLKNNEVQFEFMKKELARAQTLQAAGILSQTRYSEIYYQYRKVEAEVVRLPVKLAQDRMNAEFHRQRLQSEGNPDLDNRKFTAEVLSRSIRAEIEQLQNTRQIATCGYQLAERFLNRGRGLNAKNVITQVELDKREVVLRSAATQLEMVQNQIELAARLLSSLEESLRKIELEIALR